MSRTLSARGGTEEFITSFNGFSPFQKPALPSRAYVKRQMRPSHLPDFAVLSDLARQRITNGFGIGASDVLIQVVLVRV
jgi:hypothetical protein